MDEMNTDRPTDATFGPLSLSLHFHRELREVLISAIHWHHDYFWIWMKCFTRFADDVWSTVYLLVVMAI